MRRSSLLPLLVAAAALVACGSDAPTTSADVATEDTGGLDSGEADTPVEDTGTDDTAVTDTGEDAAEDTGSDDTAISDTGVDTTEDSGSSDGGADTTDTGSEDTTPSCVIRVCPSGCDVSTPSEAAAIVEDGCLVEIEAAEYVDCATWRATDLVIRGVNGRPHLRDQTCAGKAIFITQGAHTTVENIEFSGMAVPDRNGAAIRHEGGTLIVRGTYMHDGETGILTGGDPEREVHIEDAYFERLGRDGFAHGVYMGQIREFTARNTHFIRSMSEGHEVKSRAERTVLECNVIASLDGDSSRNIDVPQGGEVILRHNVIQQGTASPNRNIIGFALENQNNAVQSLTMEGNILINDQDRGSFVQLNGSPTLDITGNIFVGPGAWVVDHPDPEGNTRFDTREDAGYTAAPELPAVPCE